MAAVFGQPQQQYQNLAAVMAGLQQPGKTPGVLDSGAAVAGKPGAAAPWAPPAGAAPMAGTAFSPGMEKIGVGDGVSMSGAMPVMQASAAPAGAPAYSGQVFKPGQTLTADQLPAWNEWMAAGMPGTPANQLPQAAPAAPGGPSMSPEFGVAASAPTGQGYSGSVVGAGFGNAQLPGITNTTVDYSTLPGLDTDFSAMGDRVRNAMFQRTSGLLNPEHERAREATAQRLANAGIVEGSARWNEEMDRLDQQRSLSLERAGLDADVAAGDEMARLFGQALTARQQLGGERERGADRTYSQTLGTRGQLAGEWLTGRGQDVQDRASQRSADAAMAAANAQAGATASGHALQAAQAAAANDIARGRLGLEQENQGFNQWLLASQFARGGVNMPNFGTPIPLDVTGAAGIAQQGANAQAGADAARNAGYWGLASSILGPMLGGGKIGTPR